MKLYELQPKTGFDALTLVERAPASLGPRDVRVRIRAVSLNYRDLGWAKRGPKLKRPLVPASDGAGEVIEVGGAVTRHKLGDRVAANFFPTWIDGGFIDAYHAKSLGGTTDGMLAEEVVLDETAWVRTPDHLSFEEASTLPCAGVTAYAALFVAATLKAGDLVLLQGTGGVSIFALQLARAAGAEIILTSSSAAKRAHAQEMGAVHTIDYKETPAWGEAARAWTGGVGVDIGVEVGGPGTFDQTVAALRTGGTMSILGVLTGTKGEINTYAIFQKWLKVHGVYVGSVRMFEDLCRALAARRIHPVVDKVFPFGEARAAYEHLESGAHFGKVVIKLD